MSETRRASSKQTLLNQMRETLGLTNKELVALLEEHPRIAKYFKEGDVALKLRILDHYLGLKPLDIIREAPTLLSFSPERILGRLSYVHVLSSGNLSAYSTPENAFQLLSPSEDGFLDVLDSSKLKPNDAVYRRNFAPKPIAKLLSTREQLPEQAEQTAPEAETKAHTLQKPNLEWLREKLASYNPKGEARLGKVPKIMALFGIPLEKAVDLIGEMPEIVSGIEKNPIKFKMLLAAFDHYLGISGAEIAASPGLLSYDIVDLIVRSEVLAASKSIDPKTFKNYDAWWKLYWNTPDVDGVVDGIYLRIFWQEGLHIRATDKPEYVLSENEYRNLANQVNEDVKLIKIVSGAVERISTLGPDLNWLLRAPS